MSDKRGPARSCTIISSSHERTLTKEHRKWLSDVDEGAAPACERCARPTAACRTFILARRLGGEQPRASRGDRGCPRAKRGASGRALLATCTCYAWSLSTQIAQAQVPGSQ